MNGIVEIKLDEIITSGDRSYTRMVGGFGEGQEVMTDLQVAELLGHKNGARHVRELIGKNIHYFNDDDILDLKLRSEVTEDMLLYVGYSAQAITQSKVIYAFSYQGVCKYMQLAKIVKDETVSIKEYFNEDKLYFMKASYENSFGDILDELLDGLCYFERQYNVCGKYRIDFYNSQYNLAIEYDECHHSRTVEEDAQRQLEIEYSIGCHFIRVDKDDIFKGINKVFKFMLKNEKDVI